MSDFVRFVNLFFFFFFKQKTAYEMRISDWSSDVCSSDLRIQKHQVPKIQVIYIHNLNCIYEGPPIVKYSLIPQTGCSSDRCAGLKRRSAIAENSGERS